MRYVDTSVLLAYLIPEAHDVVDAYSRSVSPQLHRIAVGDADHRQAVILLDGWRTALRAGDGLHLAVASAHGATVYTLDRGMAISGATLGIPVTLIGSHRGV